MIVLKSTQDKYLAVLQSVAGIVERRHVLESFEPNKTARASVQFFRAVYSSLRINSCGSGTLLSVGLHQAGQWLTTSCLRLNGFFSASKANLRNAP